MPDKQAILTVDDMTRADRLAVDSGIRGADLMEAAGLSVVRHILRRHSAVKTLVLCGPGNNGGDGFVVARHLRSRGWDVDLALMGGRDSLSGDAAFMAAKWDGPVRPLRPDVLEDHGLVVDAVLGAGLSRPIEGELATLVDRINAARLPVVAVDIPSGLDGDSGQIRGAALRATSTVTFFRRKPGHFLLPGRRYCGDMEVADIGIPERVLSDIAPRLFHNDPALWRDLFPRAADSAHKYSRGHAVVLSGGAATGGAARLAARAALRIGAGLVSVSCPPDAVMAHAGQLTAVMIKPFTGQGDIAPLLKDDRMNAWCAGPGNGVTAQTRGHVRQILAAGRYAVLDADALTVFAARPNELFTAIHKRVGGSVVLTPHDGEFARLFPDLAAGRSDYNKLESARAAAVRSGAVLLLKGADTVIAAPDGRAVISDNGPPTLATAGSGDVLAGLVTGLLAQGMPSLEAACAAAWCHGAAAQAFGPGLISEDIAEEIPGILRRLFNIMT